MVIATFGFGGCRSVALFHGAFRQQCDLPGRPLQNGEHLLRAGKGGLLLRRQGVVSVIGFGRIKAGAFPRRIVHAVQRFRVRQSVNQLLHFFHGGFFRLGGGGRFRLRAFA